jgi:hypothetical protein
MAEEKKINNEIVERNARLYQKKTEAELEKYMADAEMSDDESKLVALVKDSEFIKSLLNAKDEFESVKLFAEKGVAMIEEECRNIRKIIVDSVAGILESDEEMTDEELESVAGGSWSGFWKGLKKVAVAALIGAAIGLAVAGGLAVLASFTVFAPLMSAAAVGSALASAAVGGAISGGLKEGLTMGAKSAGI